MRLEVWSVQPVQPVQHPQIPQTPLAVCDHKCVFALLNDACALDFISPPGNRLHTPKPTQQLEQKAALLLNAPAGRGFRSVARCRTFMSVNSWFPAPLKELSN